MRLSDRRDVWPVCTLVLLLSFPASAQDAPPGEAPPAAETPAESPDAPPSPDAGETPTKDTDEQPQADAERPAPSPPAATTPAEDEPVARPAAAAFAAQMQRWKELLRDLRDLQARYQIAEEQELDGIRQSYDQTLGQATALLPELRAAGLRAYAEAPNEDRQLTRFLLKLAADDVRADNYEAAAEITRALIAGQCDDQDVDNLAGIAAFTTNDFDAAEKYLKQADAAGVLSEAGKRFLPEVATYKQLWQTESRLRELEAQSDNPLPRVRLETTKGDIVVELLENEAPETVGNFVSLVEKGFYDGLGFHRVLEGFMAQGGCPKGDGSGGPGYEIYCECYQDNHRKHFRGSLSMAHAGRDTGGSQFFLTFVPTSHLNGRHTVFGRVVEGMEVLSKLQRLDPTAKSPAEPDRIIKAEVLRKRDHSYVPHKVS